MPKNPRWDTTDWLWFIVLVVGTVAFGCGMAYITPTWWLPRLLAGLDFVWLVLGWYFAWRWWNRTPQ